VTFLALSFLSHPTWPPAVIVGGQRKGPCVCLCQLRYPRVFGGRLLRHHGPPALTHLCNPAGQATDTFACGTAGACVTRGPAAYPSCGRPAVLAALDKAVREQQPAVGRYGASHSTLP
jgi:hypothetical protein